MRRVCLPLRRIAVNGLLQGTRDSFPPTPASGRVSSPPPLLHLACFGVNPFAHLSRRHTIPCLSPQFFFGYPQTFIHLFSLFPQLFRQSPVKVSSSAPRHAVQTPPSLTGKFASSQIGLRSKYQPKTPRPVRNTRDEA